MGLNSDAVLDATESALAKLGVYERVNMHEPKNAPGNGVTASVWVDDITPIAKRSGLAATSALLVLTIRCQTSMQTDPQDGIDRQLVKAVDTTLNAFTGDFDLGDTVAEIDLLGAYGRPMGARAGYMQQGDTTYRVIVITLPLVLNDVWTQVE